MVPLISYGKVNAYIRPIYTCKYDMVRRHTAKKVYTSLMAVNKYIISHNSSSDQYVPVNWYQYGNTVH